MSFLNPVNEPVLRFSSTDADAPQINYAARTAGDVKAVLKACLVTGYGAKASAGWSTVNEVDHVAEFVSPSAAMSDYRLGIDDTSAASTTWYYQYQDVRVNPVDQNLSKDCLYIDKSSAMNGWQLIATAKGLYFLEIVHSDSAKNKVARLTYWGQSKSALTTTNAKNIAYWSVGYNAPTDIYRFFSSSNLSGKHYNLGAYNSIKFESANMGMLPPTSDVATLSAVNIKTPIYLNGDGVFIGEQVGLLLSTINDFTEMSGVYDSTFNARPVLDVWLTVQTGSAANLRNKTRRALIYLDNWEY